MSWVVPEQYCRIQEGSAINPIRVVFASKRPVFQTMPMAGTLRLNSGKWPDWFEFPPFYYRSHPCLWDAHGSDWVRYTRTNENHKQNIRIAEVKRRTLHFYPLRLSKADHFYIMKTKNAKPQIVGILLWNHIHNRIQGKLEKRLDFSRSGSIQC